MGLSERLTVDEAIKKYNDRATMQHKSYDTDNYSPNKMREIIESELSEGRLGKILELEYRVEYTNLSLEIAVVKVGTDDEWESIGHLYNRKKDSMSGSYDRVREAYTNFVYVLQNHQCYNLNVYQV